MIAATGTMPVAYGVRRSADGRLPEENGESKRSAALRDLAQMPKAGRLAEAEPAARLQQPNIATVSEVGEQDGGPSLTMDLPGPDLARRGGGWPIAADGVARVLRGAEASPPSLRTAYR